MVESPAPTPSPSGGSVTPYWVTVGIAFALGALLLFVGGRSSGPAGGDFNLPGNTGGLSGASARRAVPDFRITKAGSDLWLTREDLAGQVVVLHFWATWCPPCRSEFPEFARYAAKADGVDGVRVLAVSLDKSSDEAMTWAMRNGGGLPVWHDRGKLANALGVTSIPTTVLLDKQGRIAYFQVGAQDWTDYGVPSRVKALRRE